MGVLPPARARAAVFGSFRERIPHPSRFAAAAGAVLPLLVALAAGLVCLFGLWEAYTGSIQAERLAELAGRATFSVRPGASGSVRFPHAGPYDRRLGYASIPAFSRRLRERGYRVEKQARFSSSLTSLTDWGLPAIFPEKPRAGLTILGRDGAELFRSAYPEKVYERFEEIPGVLVRSLLFAEDRGLLAPGSATRNPAVEWDRLLKGAYAYGMNALGFRRPVPGGSTLATQTEKLRHSPGGRTVSPSEKMRQMAAASLRAYRGGIDTSHARRRIVVDYLNGVSLGAIPGYGEIIGLPSAMEKWYGVDFEVAGRILRWPEPDSVDVGLEGRAAVFKQALSLILAARRPSLYLAGDPGPLQRRTDAYLDRLAEAGIIGARLRDAARAQPLRFAVSIGREPDRSMGAPAKIAGVLRRDLARVLGVGSLYDLDRLDLSVESTLDSKAEARTAELLDGLHDALAVIRAGMSRRRMLLKGDPSRLVYSVSVYQAGEHENLLRVQADNLPGPLDVADGTKIDLGSTAKLRVLAEYLEVLASLHRSYSGLTPEELRALPLDPWDPLSRWVVDRLANDPELGLGRLLDAAMRRRYSADPRERFLTGGGWHRFHNFDDRFDRSRIDVSTAFAHSVNLVFVRMMRDVLRYHMYGAPGAVGSSIVRDRNDPRRRAYLGRFALQEGAEFVTRAFHDYKGLDRREILEKALRRGRSSALARAAVVRSLEAEAGLSAFASMLPEVDGTRPLAVSGLRRLYLETSPANLTLADRAYVSGLQPLELWTAAYLRRFPGASLPEVLHASRKARTEAYAWLYRTRRKKVQDRKIRQVLESDGFRSVHRDWQRHGYPFGRLVPSLATAIGSSADRPAALAELMGVIVNDGVRKPTRTIERLRFAEGTPYETVFRPRAGLAERVMDARVAATLRRALARVVSDGTARLAGRAFEDRIDAPVIGGKTGTGDHRYRSGRGPEAPARAVSRSATFTFYMGDSLYGVVSAYVDGPGAAEYDFTSTLATQLFAVLAPRFDRDLGVTAGGKPGSGASPPPS